jgi:glycosyltransferase involved in cell wall biosynthesis
LKNVLILSEQIPHSVSAGNIQLLRLFSDYPADKLLVIGPPIPEGAKKLACRYETLVPTLSRLNTSRLNVWKRTARAMGWIPPVSPSRVRRLLRGFQPDLVLSLMENSDLYEAAEQFCRAQKLPLYLIVHDTNEDFEPVFLWAKGSQLAKDRRIYRFAKERFCVSPEMAAFNEQRFGVPGKVLYPISDPKIQPRPLEWSKALRQPPHLTIGYAGSTSYGYGEMMLKSLPQLAEAGARLELCCPEPSGSVADLLESPIVKWHGYKEASEAIRILQERCDVLWLPYLDPAGSYERLYSTHFPSKLVDYAAAGMPVWVTGPSLATGVRFYHHFSAFADSDIRKAKKTISEALRNQALRMCLIEEMDKKRKELSTNLKEFIL